MRTEKEGSGGGKMAQQVKALAAKPEVLSSIPGTHPHHGRRPQASTSCPLHSCVPWYMHVCVHAYTCSWVSNVI
ncbi:rCG25235 [Rattus norvegicus]|uniref:RCG25235 n=1 Tax=Rattus norvegicus TaxID=10116 RepID=A6I3Q9_RAT|nr:rCG25235 [Rattus norvegicus]